MGCKGCDVSVRLKPGEVDRILADYLRTHAEPLATPATTAQRLALCDDCPDRVYGTTCRHCGCLVEVRARLARRPCPAPAPRWPAEDPDER